MYVHQIWLQGFDQLPKDYATYSERYKQFNPDWTYKIWSEKDIRELIASKYPHLIATWEGYQYWVMKVDLGKYCILNSYAGILVDMDSNPKKSFVEFLPLTAGNPSVLHHPNTFFRRLVGVKKVTNNNFIYIPYPNHPLTQLLLMRACC